METLGNKILQNSATKFYCKKCDYRTCRKSSYKDHLLSAKHSNGNNLETNGNENLQKICKSNYECKTCKKNFKSRSGLWKHNKICLESNDQSQKDELIMMLIKQNTELIKETSEFKNMMMKVIENGTTNNSNNINSHNKTFNLQFFLNETCKRCYEYYGFC